MPEPRLPGRLLSDVPEVRGQSRSFRAPFNPKPNRSGRHPCLPYSRASQPGGRNRPPDSGAQKIPGRLAQGGVASGRQDAALYVRQRCLSPLRLRSKFGFNPNAEVEPRMDADKHG